VLFNSYEYLIYFLPAAVLGFFVFGERPRWAVRWLVVASLFFYGWWNPAHLPLIVASRVLVGLTEAAIMTCCTTLLADYFHGPRRERYFGLQVVYTTVAATVFFAVGGLSGAVMAAIASFGVVRLTDQPSEPYWLLSWRSK